MPDRKLVFDELPQLWGVVRGVMTIVGPHHDLTVMARTALALVRSTAASDDPILREVHRRIAELNLETA